MNKKIIFLSTTFSLLFFISSTVIAQKTQTPPPGKEKKTKDNIAAQEAYKKKPSKEPTYGGKILGNMRLYLEAADLMKYNAKYFSNTVYLYAYFLARPDDLKIVFRDYKKNHMILHLRKPNIYYLPHLYKGRLYEIKAKVGNVIDGRVQLYFIKLTPAFTERKLLD